ncbi:unnamed protein product [Paramecium primaurelia]|uniref:Uncharacterized protein n=1 Tax=Paramecium primaurelia TaxID=5886 RepID=A0A8S1JLG5_PARPR|nr:unnamed protein product [Paramecium primaurelia]
MTYDILIYEIVFKKICNYHSEEHLKQKFTSVENHQLKTVKQENDQILQNILYLKWQLNLALMNILILFVDQNKSEENNPFPSIRFMQEK